jgi:tryptophan synthase alpha chain
MGRIEETLKRTRGEGRLALVAFITAGYPEPEATFGLVRALVEGGADLVELGIPFSDPLADGATIQRASFRALEAGMTSARCLDIVREIRSREKDVPLILMGYCNPLLAMGLEPFVEGAAAAGVDGLIVVDLPPEEGVELASLCRSSGIDSILLLAPSSDEARIAAVAKLASGFIYCVSVAGVTGARHDLPSDLGAFLGRVRRHTSLPLAVGFGVSRREHVEALAGLADAAVVGSAIIDVIDAAPREEREEKVRQYLWTLRGVDGARP